MLLHLVWPLCKDQTDKYMKVDLFNDTYPNNFIRQIIDVNYKLADNWIFTIEKQIYYSDNIDKIDSIDNNYISLYQSKGLENQLMDILIRKFTETHEYQSIQGIVKKVS